MSEEQDVNGAFISFYPELLVINMDARCPVELNYRTRSGSHTGSTKYADL